MYLMYGICKFYLNLVLKPFFTYKSYKYQQIYTLLIIIFSFETSFFY